MPDLSVSLHKQDLGHFRIVAEFWGLELESTDASSALEELCGSLLDLEAVSETLEVLPAEARSAMNELVAADGKIEWSIFARKYGDIREMGAGKRDRERPYLKPASTAEFLFYRALVAKAFFDLEKGSQEFAYIPEDLLEIINEVSVESVPLVPSAEALGRPATPVEKTFETLANDFVLDDATTYLAALRIGHESKTNFKRELPLLLTTAGVVKNDGLLPEAVKKFLEISRKEALDLLYNAWLESTSFDELRLIPGIVCEGEWKSQAQVTREFLMNLVNDIPAGKWWSIPAFVKAIKEKYPDYQRPAGDYDSWFIKRASDGQFMRGFAYWDFVDGALIKYLIQILHWLGKVDLAAPEEGKEPTAFRLVDVQPENLKTDVKLNVASTGKISIPRTFSRTVRYQLARFCEWNEPKGDEYFYRVTAESLKRATEQGLKAEQLLAMLVKYTKETVPPAMVKALKRWDANGSEARVESLLVLRVSKPEIMEEMRKSKAGKYFGEVLSPTAIVVKSGAIQKVLAELAELGLLAEIKTNE